jgi:transposase
MGKPHSVDLHERVVAAIEHGVSTRLAAGRFSIGIATAGTWARLKRRRGRSPPNDASRRVPCLMRMRISVS